MDFDQWLISRLRYHGAYDGVTDSVHGRAVINAIERFQRAQGIRISGVADDATVAALRADTLTGKIGDKAAPAIPREPVWVREARRFMGLKEISGPKYEPTIVDWAKRFGGWIAKFYVDDDIPWCGLFVGHVVAVTLPREKLPANVLGALQWAKFGRELNAPAPGAILVFKRAGGGHVGFYIGETSTHYIVLGGNQNNSVSVTRIEKKRLVNGGIRWPTTGEQPGLSRVLASSAPITTDEA